MYPRANVVSIWWEKLIFMSLIWDLRFGWLVIWEIYICLKKYFTFAYIYGPMLGEADICVFDLRRDLVGFAWGVSPIVPQQCNSSNLERSHRAKAYFCEYSILIFCRKTQFKTSFRLSPFKGTKVTMPIFSLSTMSPFPSVQIRFWFTLSRGSEP